MSSLQRRRFLVLHGVVRVATSLLFFLSFRDSTDEYNRLAVLQPSCQYGVYPVRRVLRPLSPCAFICHTLTQSRHRPTRCFVEGGRLAVACSRFRSAVRLKVRPFVGRVSSFRAHDPKQLHGASVDLSSPAACPSRARPWDVRVKLSLASFHIITELRHARRGGRPVLRSVTVLRHRLTSRRRAARMKELAGPVPVTRLVVCSTDLPWFAI